MDQWAAIARGSKGGSSTSPAKRRAARKNGELCTRSSENGRPRTLTLAESILRRKLSKEQHGQVREAYARLTIREQRIFKKFFRLDLAWLHYPSMDTKAFVPHRKPNERMQHILRKFRLVARYLLAGGW